MASLQKKLSEMLPENREKIAQLVKEYGDKIISQVTVKQAYGGMRGVKSLICDTSLVEPDKGLVIRGRPILDLVDKLPEEVFFLLLTGDLPDETGLKSLQKDLRERQDVPQYVWDVLSAMGEDAHPMTMLSTAILVMQRDSVFAREYRRGISKTEYWKPVLEDALRIVARLPEIAAFIYRKRFNKGQRIEPRVDLDWAGNFAHMLGITDLTGNFADLIRLYMVLHSDHEGCDRKAW